MLKIFNNKVIIFIVSRYFSYLIQFLNSLIVAYVLGPYYMGIWGFILLMIQYFNFGNFGIDIALNVTLSTGDLSDEKKQSKIASNAFVATFFTSVLYLTIGLILYLSGVSFFEKFMFTKYMFIIIIISCLNYFNVLFLNIFRTYSLFTPISIFQTIVQLFQLPMLFIFKDSPLIWSMLFATLAAHGVSFFIFLKKLPIRLDFKVDSEIIKNLYKRGISLLSYALTFYILLLSTRSMVGYFYPVETMGLFSFAANIAAALIVGLSSLEFVLFPKMLNRLSSDEVNLKSMGIFSEIRYMYMVTTFLIIVLGLIAYPFLLSYFKDYQDTEVAFCYLAVSQIIISSGFGYATLIISKGKEFFLVIHGLIALGINLALSVICLYFFDISYSTVPLMLIFAFLYYYFQVIRKGRELLNVETSILEYIEALLPAKSLVSLLFIACSIITKQHLLFYLLSLVSFIVFNFKALHIIKKYAAMLFNKPSIVNINND